MPYSYDINDTINFLNRMYIDNENIKSIKKQLHIKLNHDPTQYEVLLTALNDLIVRLIEKELYDYASVAYYEMALLLNGLNRNAFLILQQSVKAQLFDYRQQGIKKVIILAGICDKCKELDQKVFTIEQAIKDMPLPCRKCSTKLSDGKNSFCKCLYAPHYD
jgi:hypothetical protein